MALKNLEHERAKFAMGQVTAAKTTLGDNRKYYRSYVKKMPSLILGSGLIAAMAFCQKQKDEGKSKSYRLMHDSLFNWLKIPANAGLLQTNKAKFLDALLDQNSHQMRLLTAESIALLGWMKRMAEAEIEEEADND
jgi:CRISPR-associated protein Cmr5